MKVNANTAYFNNISLVRVGAQTIDDYGRTMDISVANRVSLKYTYFKGNTPQMIRKDGAAGEVLSYAFA